MARTSLFVCLFLFSAAIALAAAPSETRPASFSDLPIHGATVGVTAVDTTLLVGSWRSGAPINGQFQTPGVAPDWNGWTSLDLTDIGGNHWHAADYNVIAGSYSAWCGSLDFLSCGAGDPDGGYGDGWNDVLYWQGAVADPDEPCTIRIQATVNVDTEIGYDYGYVQAVTQGGVHILWELSGLAPGETVDEEFVFEPGDYVGDGADEVRIQFSFVSDDGYSDEDCEIASAGALQVDDVIVTLSNGAGYSHDFEDGSLGDFVPEPVFAVGDYAKIWTNLGDLDECHENSSPRIAFVDDGLVVPGTGGTRGTEWTYGPYGYVVNWSGGLAGPEGRIHNAVVSPVLTLPVGADGMLLAYDTWWHNDLEFFGGDPASSANILGWSGVRSVASGNPADLADAPWVGDPFFRDIPMGTYRHGWDLSERLIPGATHVQVAVGIKDFDSVSPLSLGENSSPGPYYDNIRITAFERAGPAISAFPQHLARDGFPASGVVNGTDLGSNSVRFDMIDDPDFLPGDLDFTAGDSVVVRIDPREGATLAGTPRMHYRLNRNEFFDSYRTAGLPDLGSVDLTHVAATTWSADLPDEGFLFPGDWLHYYFEAEDDLGGDVRTSTLPADTTGFSSLASGYTYRYNDAFKVRALPRIEFDPYPPGYVLPRLLFWHDSGRTDDWSVWESAFNFLAFYARWNFDIFDTKTTDLAARTFSVAATVPQLESYDLIIYAGGLDDTGLDQDLALLEDWLQTGNKRLFLTGHRIAGDLDAFSAWTGTSVAGDDLRLLVGGQMAPKVQYLPGNPVLATIGSWLAFGECPDLAPAQAVTTTGSGLSLAEYLDPQDTAGMYPYAALILNVHAGTGSRVITLPWDFTHVHTDPDESWKADAVRAARVRMLKDVINYFGIMEPLGFPVNVPVSDAFAVTPHPNPFNPTTTVAYSIKGPGHLSLRVFDLRGALVATLLDGRVEQSGAVQWHGRDDAGAQVASGMYFYEARMGEEAQIGKLMLLK